MKRIEIEVSEETAEKWLLASPQMREKISGIMDIKLAKELTKDTPEEFKQFLDEIGETLHERGLTEEILQEILREDE